MHSRVFPDSHKLLKWILSISPMVIASPIPLAIMNAITPHSNFGQVNRTFLASSNCMLVMMDLVLLYVFARFLGMMRSVAGSSSSGLAESKFNTICVFGSVAVSLCAVQSAGAVWFATMQWDVVAEYEYVLGWTSCFMGVRVLVMLVMLGMKWGLFRGAVEEVKLKVRGKEVELKFKSGVFSRATPSALGVKQSVMEQSEMNKSAFAEKSAGAISKMERTDTESLKSRMERGETFTFKENAILEIQEIMKAGNNDTIHRSLKHEVVENTGDTEDKDTDIAWKIFQDYLNDE
ncbi:hypothetical protein HDU79_004939 [Rhizoclosmatium sp. JEL0117]|nr:hypothetical protein HDU79_004939 [Rhizoclosmatium sp. JEL0117]